MSKKKSSKETVKLSYKEKQKIRYRAVLNTWGDTKLASRVRGLSDETIEERYGVIVPNKLPNKKSFTNKQKQNKQKQLRKFIEANNYRIYNNEKVNVNEIAKKVKRGISLDRIISYIDSKETKTIDFKKIPKKPIFKDNLSIQEKRKQWASWSDNKNFPSKLMDIIRKINIMYGCKGDDIENMGFGYTVVFNAYLDNISWEEAYEKVKFLDFKVPQLYTYTKQLGY